MGRDRPGWGVFYRLFPVSLIGLFWPGAGAGQGPGPWLCLCLCLGLAFAFAILLPLPCLCLCLWLALAFALPLPLRFLRLCLCLAFPIQHVTFHAWLVAQAQAETAQIRLRKVVVSMVLPEAQVKVPPKSGGEHGLPCFRLGVAWTLRPP